MIRSRFRYGPRLLRFARSRLRNAVLAEDAVSETLLAALAKPQAFDNRSQLKTWLIGILKHKLVDQIRRNCRELSTTTADDEQDLVDRHMNRVTDTCIPEGEAMRRIEAAVAEEWLAADQAGGGR